MPGKLSSKQDPAVIAGLFTVIVGLTRNPLGMPDPVRHDEKILNRFQDDMR